MKKSFIILILLSISICSYGAKRKPQPPSPTFVVSPTTLNFGNVNVGQTSNLNYTFSDVGKLNITGSIIISGTGFSMNPSSIVGTMSPGTSPAIPVTFTPPKAGNFIGSINIKTNATDPVLTIPLTGTGIVTVPVAHEADLSWMAPVSSPEPISSYAVVRSDGQAFSTTQLSYVDKTVVSGQTYKYYVESIGINGALSNPSNTVTVVIP